MMDLLFVFVLCDDDDDGVVVVVVVDVVVVVSLRLHLVRLVNESRDGHWGEKDFLGFIRTEPFTQCQIAEYQYCVSEPQNKTKQSGPGNLGIPSRADLLRVVEMT
mmetsp:Transcript_19816/g.40954  ORF Transcript_19816/g.40954 Transcript_19816/m.40954 type:complete len:105 (+) Transcript_19816:594-908(+)